MCFYALVGSGLDTGDASTFDNAFTDATVQEFAQTGTYTGKEGIAEYLSFVAGGNFVLDYIRIGDPLFMDMTGSTVEQCIATIAERRRMPFNSAFTVDNQEMCVDAVSGTTISYTMTGNPAAPIQVQSINAWLPDELISSAVALTVGSPATAVSLL